MNRVLQFGCPFGPRDGLEETVNQMRLGHEYYNARQAVEREARAYTRDVFASVGNPAELDRAVEDAKKRVEDLATEIKTARASTRTRWTKQESADALKQARADLKTARAALGEFRRSLRENPVVAKKLAKMSGERPAREEGEASRRHDNSVKNDGIRAQRMRALRAEYGPRGKGLGFGTYLLVEAAHGDSVSKTPLYDREGEPNDPKFHRWAEGTKHVAVHVQGWELTGASIFAPNDWTWIDPVDSRAWLKETPRGERKRLSRTVLHLRLKTGEDKEPVWAHVPIILHREIPSDAKVSWIVLSMRRQGPRTIWTCEITIQQDETQAVPEGNGTVAVVLGWQKVHGGIRAARSVDTGGVVTDLVLGDVDLKRLDKDGGRGGIVSGITRCDSLKKTRDDNFNVALAALVGWLREHDMPDWMRARTTRDREHVPSKKQALAWMADWKAQGKLAALCIAWRENRFSGDDSAFAALETWRYHDHHMWRWVCDQTKSAHLRRREAYRLFGIKMAKHAKILLDGTDFAKLSFRPKTEDAKGYIQGPAANRTLVAPHELRETIKQAGVKVRRDVVKSAPEGTAITCPKCGNVDKVQRFDDGEYKHTFCCVECGTAGDLNTIRALNMLVAGGHKKEVLEILRRQDEQLQHAAE